MLGVIADPTDEDVVREFFELFKVPWEFYSADRQYDVVLCAADRDPAGISGKLILVYAGREVTFDAGYKTPIDLTAAHRNLSFAGVTVPIYGKAVNFSKALAEPQVDVSSNNPLACLRRVAESTVIRIGYDLFSEVRTLLADGQPASRAVIPTLDLHVAFLRRLITGFGLPLAEVPPVPEGHRFIACLTHDLDHAVLRRHLIDATMLGFLYRATLVSAFNTARGRLRPTKLLRNWLAAAKLPFVYAGLAQDFWLQFDRYLEMEAGRPSTFFAIPFERRPGRSANGEAPAARASAYDVSHISEKIRVLKAAGCEIGLHGIDAWTDSRSGREEAARISSVSGNEIAGVRMHWLYRDEKSPLAWEEAGFSYDSTIGYNETVGYRAGTTQIFRPLQATRLLELPLHVMDTALFYPDYLGLSEDQAWNWLGPIFDNAMQRGGVLTINWHDRSIAPERQWGEFYCRMLADLTERGALFCTAAQAVSWFQKRRSVTFQKSPDGNYGALVGGQSDAGSPPMRLRLYQSDTMRTRLSEIQNRDETYVDTALRDQLTFRLAS